MVPLVDSLGLRLKRSDYALLQKKGLHLSHTHHNANRVRPLTVIAYIWISMFTCLMASVVFSFFTDKSTIVNDGPADVVEKSENQAHTQPAKPNKKDIIRKIYISDWSWRKSGFGSIILADFSISNYSGYDVKDVVIQITFTANSGTVLGTSKQTIYEYIPTGKTVELKEVNCGFVPSQASGAGGKVSDAVILSY